MNTISITTSQNIEIEYELASIGDRIVAYLIDGLIIIAYVVIVMLTLNFGVISSSNLWIFFLLFLPVMFYSLINEIVFNGQSVGKKAMSTKVISLNGEQPTLSQYLLRWLFRLVDFSVLTGLIALVTVALTEKKQRVGDLVAGTTVVKTKRRTGFDQTFYAPTAPTDYVVTYPEVINLRDTDIQLVKEVILSVQRSGNSFVSLQAQQKIEKVLNIKSRDPEPIYFLNRVLADYNHLTATL
jgi:uncharacterized RDD family membrane protein YckC